MEPKVSTAEAVEDNNDGDEIQEGQQPECSHRHRSPSPCTCVAANVWAELGNTVLRARAHLLHSRTDVNNANSLVLALSDLLERIRDEQRQRPLSPLIMGALEEEEEERDQREEEPEELFESMILFNGGNEQRLCPHSMDKKRSIFQQSIANSILPMDRKRSAAMNLKKRSMVAPAFLQGMPFVERGSEHQGDERRPSAFFLEAGKRPSSCSTARNGLGSAECGWDRQQDPALLRALPHLAILSVSILWLLLGAFVFRWLDPEIGAKPFHRALLYAFELCTSIGWGDSRSSNTWSQVFCVLFTLLGVPFLFSAFANLGRLITEFYCVDWLFLSAIVRRKQSTVGGSPALRRRFPLRLTLNLLLLHQCLGVLLYSRLLRDFPVIASIYFSITSMATIGLGDFSPEPANWGETLLALGYFSSGIILLSALYLTIAYHFQTFFYISMGDTLHRLYIKYWREKRRQSFGDERQSDILI